MYRRRMNLAATNQTAGFAEHNSRSSACLQFPHHRRRYSCCLCFFVTVGTDSLQNCHNAQYEDLLRRVCKVDLETTALN